MCMSTTSTGELPRNIIVTHVPVSQDFCSKEEMLMRLLVEGNCRYTMRTQFPQKKLIRTLMGNLNVIKSVGTLYPRSQYLGESLDEKERLIIERVRLVSILFCVFI